MRTPSRIPVQGEQFLMNAIAISWPHITNKEIRFSLNVLGEQLQGELDRKMGRKNKKEIKQLESGNTENEDLRKFIALFRDRYAQETDMEYRTKLAPEEIGAIKNIVKKLREKTIGSDYYLSWIFDDFFEDEFNQQKFSPTINFICGTFVASRFFMNNRDKFRKKNAEVEKKNRRDSIRDYGISLFRRTKDEEIQRMLKKEYEGTITTEYLENWIKNKEESLQGDVK